MAKPSDPRASTQWGMAEKSLDPHREQFLGGILNFITDGLEFYQQLLMAADFGNIPALLLGKNVRIPSGF